MRTLSVALVLVAVAFAGCVSDAEPIEAAAVAPQPVDPEPTPEPAAPAEPAVEENVTEPTNVTPPADPAPPPPPPPPAPTFRTERGWGNLTGVGAGVNRTQGEVCCAALGPEPLAEGTVRTTVLEPGTTAFLVELRWTNVTFDLDLVLKASDYAEKRPTGPGDTSTYSGHRYTQLAQEGTGRTFLLLTDAEALALTGEWTVEVQSKGPASTPFEIAITHVRSAPIPDGWSAFA